MLKLNYNWRNFNKKITVILLTLVMFISLMPLSVSAAVKNPTSLTAPPHFGVTYRGGDNIKLYISASDSIRDYIASRVQEEPENRDLKNFVLYYQVDAKINNGSWQYTSGWDSPKTVPDNQKNMYYISCQDGEYYAGAGYAYFVHLFSDKTIAGMIEDTGWDYFKNNSMTFRARFAQTFDNGETYVLSPWSKEFVLSHNVKLDPNKMINNAPTLKGVEIEMYGDSPYLAVKLEKPPHDIGDLNVATGGYVGAQIWLRKEGDKDFKQVHYWWVSDETIKFNAQDYFEDYKGHYEEIPYEIKTRYFLDLEEYRHTRINSTSSREIYSPFSNVISHNMPAWEKASQWATTELRKADEAGLIPDILKGADLTKPITREEFCELALLLYEKTTGKSPAPMSPNPFTDSKNPQVLKAFALGITTGTSATTFSPQVLINREQCATMLYRALKAIAPGGSYSIAGIKDFPDQKNISAYAVEGAKYMSKLGIIKGDNNGNFMPKATTTAQEATGYGAATREASILMSVRSYDQIESGALGTPTGDGYATQPAKPNEPAQPMKPIQPSQTSMGNSSIVGKWGKGMTGAMYNIGTGSFDFGIYGTEQEYQFDSDGTFTILLKTGSGSVTSITGNYTVSSDKITFIYTGSKSSSDFGKTWSEGNTIKPASYYYELGKDDDGRYLIIGLEDAIPPLDTETNAVQYSFRQ